MHNLDCNDARWLIEAARDGRGFEDEEERQEYQQACDHVQTCGCDTCRKIVRQLDGEFVHISIGQA